MCLPTCTRNAEHVLTSFFGGPYNPEKIKYFWKTVVKRRDPRIMKHPMCSKPDWMEKSIPISLHADAVPCVSVGKAGSKLFDKYSWQSILCHGSTAIKMYLFGLLETVRFPTLRQWQPTPLQPAYLHICTHVRYQRTTG